MTGEHEHELKADIVVDNIDDEHRAATDAFTAAILEIGLEGVTNIHLDEDDSHWYVAFESAHFRFSTRHRDAALAYEFILRALRAVVDLPRCSPVPTVVA
jgi:hypothetical protein